MNFEQLLAAAISRNGTIELEDTATYCGPTVRIGADGSMLAHTYSETGARPWVRDACDVSPEFKEAAAPFLQAIAGEEDEVPSHVWNEFARLALREFGL